MTLSPKTLAVLQGGTQGPFGINEFSIGEPPYDYYLYAKNGVVGYIPKADKHTDAFTRFTLEDARKIALVNALADVAVKAAEERVARKHHEVTGRELGALSTTIPEEYGPGDGVSRKEYNKANRRSMDACFALRDAVAALDASLANLEAEASKHG